MEEEISLREMLEILLKGKWIIITVTALAILGLMVSAMAVFFINYWHETAPSATTK